MARLSLVDCGFLALETAESPKHVTGLLVLDMPEHAGPRFLSELFETFQSSMPVPPFSQKVGSSLGLPTWTDDPAIDMQYHVRRHVLPDPGSRTQLVELVSGLHEERLDRSRPLWQFHLIEGLKGGRAVRLLCQDPSRLHGRGEDVGSGGTHAQLVAGRFVGHAVLEC